MLSSVPTVRGDFVALLGIVVIVVGVIVCSEWIVFPFHVLGRMKEQLARLKSARVEMYVARIELAILRVTFDATIKTAAQQQGGALKELNSTNKWHERADALLESIE